MIPLETAKPITVDRRFQLALRCQRNDEPEQAEFIYRSILSDDPLHAPSHHYLGLLLYRTENQDEALEHLGTSLRLAPDKAAYHNNLGAILWESGRHEDAEKHVRKALELDPDYADARSNLGCFLLHRQEFHAAKSELDLTLRLQPDHPDAARHLQELHLKQGNQYFVQEQFHEANRSFSDAASLPGGRELWRWKPLGFCPSLFSDEKSVEDYWNKLDRSLNLALDAEIPVDWRTLPSDGFTPSFNLPHQGNCCRDLKEKFARIFQNAFPPGRPTLRQTRRNRKKIRIGFVVTSGHHRGFLRVHRHLLEYLDENIFEIRFFCPPDILAECRHAIRRDDPIWVPLPSPFEKAVRTLRDADCDLLYHWKAGGGMLDYFLPMANAAPVQCTSYGTHGTSGIDSIDYYLSSNFIETTTHQRHYTEKLVLFDAYPTIHQRELANPTATREEFGLPEQGAIYFCPHRLQKYHPSFDAYFKGILEADPAGHLLLLGGRKPEKLPLLQARLEKNLGKDLCRRIRLLPAQSNANYKKLLRLANCVLDSPIYSGDLTTHDAFDLGAAVVTEEGDLLVQRYTSGLYRRMELPHLIAQDREQYVDLAVKLGTNEDFRRETSRLIGERILSVFSPDETVKAYEDFFETVCNLYD